MELSAFVQSELDRINQANQRVLNGLTKEELAWQPNPQANSIGYLLFHCARFEDTFVLGRLQGKPQLWETAKWFEKLGFPLTETGSGYTEEQVKAFKMPDITSLLAYSDAVRAQTKAYLNGLSADQFDRTVNMGRMGEMSIGNVFSLIVLHLAQHTGEISYIRGLKRGMNK